MDDMSACSEKNTASLQLHLCFFTSQIYKGGSTRDQNWYKVASKDSQKYVVEAKAAFQIGDIVGQVQHGRGGLSLVPPKWHKAGPV